MVSLAQVYKSVMWPPDFAEAGLVHSNILLLPVMRGSAK